jgi:uncharacterized phage protein gp47/JayE
MADPITLPIETDPAELEDIAFEFMESAVPGWNRARGDAASQVIQACARIIAEGRDTASDVPLAINRYDAYTVDGLLPRDATSAQTTATVTALDDDGYLIADGTRFEIKTSGDTGQVFLSVGDVTIPPDSMSTAAGEIVLIAETPGAQGSGLPMLSPVEPVDSLAWIDTVALTAVTTGGVDAETEDEHLARWIELRRLSRRTPILAEHFAAIAKVLVPGVGRALGVDNYNPADGTYGNEKMVALFITDISGEPTSGDTEDETEALLESLRELNFVVHVLAPSYAEIDVTAEVTTYPGFDAAGVEAGVEAALLEFLSPATANNPPNVEGDGGGEEWIQDDAVRYLDVAAVVKAEGVHKITLLEIAESGDALGTADIPLPAPAGLMRPGTISVTAVAP